MVSRVDAFALLKAAEDLALRAEREPLSGIAWLPGQIAWLSDPGPNPKLFRAGVRSGKSLAACQEVIGRATGKHPFRDDLPEPPVRIAFITSDKQAQGVQIMKLFWELCPKDELDPSVDFNSRTGFRGHVPVVRFRNGSEVVWYSNNAGPKTLQGSEYDYIQIDEPCSEEMFLEAENRVRNAGGQVGITLTPLHLPVPWLQKMCEDGLVNDHHYPLTVENQTPPLTGVPRTTKDGTPWNAEFIAALRARRQGPDAPITLDGHWEMRSEGQFFDCWDSKYVVDTLPSGSLVLVKGLDYAGADREMGMTAVLSAVYQVEEDDELVPHIHAIDEVVMPGVATTKQFEQAVSKMLKRHKIEWHELDAVWGDNPVTVEGQTSSNAEMQKYVARRMRVPYRALRPVVMNVKEGAGASHRSRSVKNIRCRWMWQHIAAGRVHVHSRCEYLIKAFEQWDYGDKHPMKDVLDAFMYGLRDLWASKREQKRYDVSRR